jgi:hypothetical protein
MSVGRAGIKKIKTIHLEHMLYNYIFVYKSIVYNTKKIEILGALQPSKTLD